MTSAIESQKTDYRGDVTEEESQAEDVRGGDRSPQNAEHLVYQELWAARKATEGLSPHAMALCPTVTGLLGNGDPMVAFGRLQANILEALEQGDDVQALEAAAYSLGLASHGRTHLDRLNDFGELHGYEARQARRHSDKGIRQLARLICTNWVFQTAPTAEVIVGQQLDSTIVLTIRTKRQRFINMRALRISKRLVNGTTIPFDSEPLFVYQPTVAGRQPDGTETNDVPAGLWHSAQLTKPLRLPAPQSEQPTSVEITWKGEIWPMWRVITLVLQPDFTITSQALAAGLIVTIQPLSKWRAGDAS